MARGEEKGCDQNGGATPSSGFNGGDVAMIKGFTQWRVGPFFFGFLPLENKPEEIATDQKFFKNWDDEGGSSQAENKGWG